MEEKRTLGARLLSAFVTQRRGASGDAAGTVSAAKPFLHVGCGPQTKMGLKGFNNDAWREIRFDIDTKVNPDIVGTLTDMSLVPSSSVDAVYSSHNIEHVFAHEVPVVLKEFHRVLKPGGIAIVTCPDLQSVCEFVANGVLLEPLYDSPAGPISAIDILYGWRDAIARGEVYMAHKCGFTYATLQDSVLGAGFKNTFGCRRPKSLDLWLIGFKAEATQEAMQAAAVAYLP